MTAERVRRYSAAWLAASEAVLGGVASVRLIAGAAAFAAWAIDPALFPDDLAALRTGVAISGINYCSGRTNGPLPRR